jgi:hypothetical protein
MSVFISSYCYKLYSLPTFKKRKRALTQKGEREEPKERTVVRSRDTPITAKA